MLKDILEARPLLNARVDLTAGWQFQGRCASHGDPELWFAPMEDSSPRYAHLDGRAKARAKLDDRSRAKEMCRACPVRVQCLQFSMTDPAARDSGMWGGLDKTERNKLINIVTHMESVA